MAEAQQPSVPVLVNGVVPAEPPMSEASVVAQRLPDAVGSPVTSSVNSGQDLNMKGSFAETSNQSPPTAKAFPQVCYQAW